MALSAAAIAAIIAAVSAAAAGGTAGAAGANVGTQAKNKTDPTTKYSGWGAKVADFFGTETDVSDSELGKWFKDNYDGDYSDYINSLDNASLGAILNQYYESENIFGGKKHTFNEDAAISDLENLIGSLEGYEAPVAPNFDEIYEDAQNMVNLENEELLKSLEEQYKGNLNLLDENAARQTQMYNDELANINSMYNDYSRQLLTNDYMKNAQLMGTVQSALSKSKQNALEAGASAGSRLAENINTIMATQNKQTQQSLETSNQLAQAMLNQRQAAAGIRGNYNDMLNSNTQSRIGLASDYGNAQRNIKQDSAFKATNYANQQFQTQNSIYQNQMDNYDRMMATQSSNPFYGSYQSYRQTKNKNNQGY